MLALNGVLNAFVAMNRLKDLIGPGWANVMQTVLEIRSKSVVDQVQCPFIRPRVSVEQHKLYNI